MTLRTKKILFAVSFVLASIGIGIGLWFLFFRPLILPPSTTVPSEALTSAELPEAGFGTPTIPSDTTGAGELIPSQDVAGGITQGGEENRVTLLQDTVTQAIVPGSNGQGARYYSPEDGRFYALDADGNIVRLAEKQFYNVDTVNWSHVTDKAILEFPDGNNVLFDFETDRQTTLPKHWEDFNFSPDDEQIVAKSVGLDEGTRFLIVSDPSGGEARAVESLGGNQNLVTPSWSPNNQIIAYSMTGSAQPDGAQQILFVGENHENFKSLIAPGRGFIPNWSPTGKQILFSVYHERSELKPQLWIAGGQGDSIGENRHSLKLNTWADKCAWKNENELICGVPQSLDYGAGLAPQNFRSTPDDIYSINLTTGLASKINTPDQILPIRQPTLSADKTKLIFSHAVTGRLYEYDLSSL